VSVKAISWAWEQQGLTHCEKLVLLALADHADDEGFCWPGVTRVAKKCGMSERGVRGAIKSMASVKHSLISIQRRFGNGGVQQSNLYRLIFERAKHPEAGSPQPEHSSPSPESRSRGPGTGQQGDPEHSSPKPSLEPSIEPSTTTNTAEQNVISPKLAKSTTTKRRRGLTQIDPNFQPDLTTRNRLIQHGINDQFITEQISEFVAYWLETGESKKAWQNTFFNNVKRQWIRSQSINHNKVSNNYAANQSAIRPKSAAARVAENARREREQLAATASGVSNQPVGENDADVWPPVGQFVRGGDRPSERVGQVLEGDYTRTDC